MIRGITVQRANVAPAICSPVQWSQLLQIAVNNGSLLTVLDPILPTIHTSIVQSSSAQPVLDLRALFHINTEIHAADVVKNEPRPLLDLSISTVDQSILFGNFSDLQIVAHKWSSASSTTRNTYLAILLNTSELFILERASAVPTYRVKYNLTNTLIHQLSPEITDGDLSLTNDQYLEVKAINFDFAIVDSNPILAVSMANGSIKLFRLEDDLPLIRLIPFASVMTKLTWSPSSSILLASSDINEVYLINFNNLTMENTILVKERGRFLVSQMQWLSDDFFVVTTTTLLEIFSKSGDKIESISLISNVLVNGMVINKLDGGSTFLIHVTFENGQVMKLEFDGSKKIRRIDALSIIESIIARNLFKYQMDNSMKEEDNKGNFGNNNDIVEGKYYGYSTVLNGNVVCMVSRIVPKRAVNYMILSKVEYQIDFIPVGELDPRILFTSPNCTTTSLGYLTQYWICHYSEFPAVPLQLDISTTYIEKLQAFTRVFSTEDSSRVIPESIGGDVNLVQFKTSKSITQLQLSLNVNNSVLETCNILLAKTKGTEGKETITLLLEQLIAEIVKAKTEIIDRIYQILSNLVKHLSGERKDSSDIDDFIIGSYGGQSKGSRIELAFGGVEEGFEANNIDKMEITSLSGHRWRRCNLTMLPIMQTSNRTGETGIFEYTTSENFDSNLVLQLSGLNYCVYTGNRTFRK